MRRLGQLTAVTVVVCGLLGLVGSEAASAGIKSDSVWTVESPGAPAGYPTCENVTFSHRHFGGGRFFQDDQGDGGWWVLHRGELTMHWASDLPLFVGTYSKKHHEFQGTFTYLPDGSPSGDVVKGEDPDC